MTSVRRECTTRLCAATALKQVVWRQKVGFSLVHPLCVPASLRRRSSASGHSSQKYLDTVTDADYFAFMLRDMLSACLGQAGIDFTALFYSSVFLPVSVPAFVYLSSFLPVVDTSCRRRTIELTGLKVLWRLPVFSPWQRTQP